MGENTEVYDAPIRFPFFYYIVEVTRRILQFEKHTQDQLHRSLKPILAFISPCTRTRILAAGQMGTWTRNVYTENTDPSLSIITGLLRNPTTQTYHTKLIFGAKDAKKYFAHINAVNVLTTSQLTTCQSAYWRIVDVTAKAFLNDQWPEKERCRSDKDDNEVGCALRIVGAAYTLAQRIGTRCRSSGVHGNEG